MVLHFTNECTINPLDLTHIKELMNEAGLETIPVEMSHLESGDPGESEMTTVSHLLLGPPPTDS